MPCYACRTQEAALTGQIDAANADLANAQQAAKMKEQDLQQLERRRENLHQQVGEQADQPITEPLCCREHSAVCFVSGVLSEVQKQATCHAV